MNKDIFSVADQLLREMDALTDNKIVLSTQLMMDLETTSLDEKPEVPYRHQVEMTSEIAKRHPGRLIPFLMVDPRRYEVLDLVKVSLEQKGFLGVKMYPSFGYNPDPGFFFTMTTGSIRN